MGPKVTVLTSTFNRAKTFLPKCIKSVQEQSFQDYEHIIIDDCSTDNTREMVEAFADPKIKYIRLDENSGSDTKPKNVGIMASQGEYIAYLDDDCSFRRDHLRVLAEFLDNHKETDVVYGDFWINDEKSPGQKGISMDFNGQFLMLRNFIDTSVVMHRREAIFDIGGWDETLPKFVDWNVWVRMYKSDHAFKHLPLLITDYATHQDTKSNRVKTRMYWHRELGQYLFEPTFDPTGCYIYLPYLGENQKETQPRVAIFTLTYDRLGYTKRMIKSLTASTRYPYDWFVVDNGSTDGTVDWLKKKGWPKVIYNEKNMGISRASNQAIDEIMKGDYQIIIKIDNDCEFVTKGWLEDIVDIWKRSHKVYISPYVEGLVHNPGGAPRIGHAFIGDSDWGDKTYYIEVTRHIGGIFAAVWSKAYKDFRWQDEFLHGSQDREASVEFLKMGYMPCYLPKHRINHIDSTEGQWEKYKEYFERRKIEKITKYREEK